MLDFQCPACGRRGAVPDDLAGKRVKCKCGASYRMPPAVPGPAASTLRPACPHCGQALDPGWKTCPACGRRVAVVERPSGSTEIRAGDNSVVKADVDQPTDVHMGGDVPPPVKPAGERPLIQTGGESVVKAEIDTSRKVFVEGDMVSRKEVHSTHQETHIHQHESTARAVLQGLMSLSTPFKEQEEKLGLEYQAALSSDAALFAFARCQTAALEALSFTEFRVQRQLVQTRYSLAMQALETIEQRNAGRLEVLNRVRRLSNELRDTLALKTERHRKQLMWLSIIGVGLLAVLLAFLLPMVAVERRQDQEVQREVQQLIDQGKYGEARIRAQGLSGSDNVKRMIEAIDRAEQSSRPSAPPDRNDR